MDGVGEEEAMQIYGAMSIGHRRNSKYTGPGAGSMLVSEEHRKASVGGEERVTENMKANEDREPARASSGKL